MKSDKKPFANSYWIVPGRLLAGEHPLVRDAEESAVRLQNLLLAGVTRFINLTAEDELPDYTGHLPLRFGGKPVEVERLSIRDHSVPDKPELMTLILDRIDAALHNDDLVYVHCRAGIGRTGTVLGCHLVRQGLSGEAALEQLNKLWQANARSASWPTVPETDEQEQFILDYARLFSITPLARKSRSIQPAANAERSLHDRYQGVVLGMAVAESLAAQWQQHGSTQMDVQRLDRSAWGSDTAMTWALADSLLRSAGMQAKDQMQRYQALIKHKQYCNHQGTEVPQMVSKAVALWQWKHNALAGSYDPAVVDAHPLARAAAVALYYRRQPTLCLLEAANSARTSLQSPVVLDACRVFAAVLVELLNGQSIATLVSLQEGSVMGELRNIALKPALQTVIDGGWRHALNEPAGDDIVSVLVSALHALFTTHNFQDAIVRCVQNATRPMTVAAVCGALAGALYGVQGLPIIWRETLPRADELLQLADRLMREAPSP